MAFDLIIHEIRMFVANRKSNSRGREEEMQDIICISALHVCFIFSLMVQNTQLYL